MQATLAKIAGISLFLLLLPTAVLSQTTWYVDDDNTTGPWDGSQANPFQHIQDGIDAASDSDIVLVMPGKYIKKVDFLGKAITVISKAGPRATFILPEKNCSAIVFKNGEGRNSVLQGFTIMEGRGSLIASNDVFYIAGGGGIYCYKASPTIRDNIIRNNVVEVKYSPLFLYAYGGGIYCERSSAIIINNYIARNKVVATPDHDGSGSAWGGGICSYNSDLTIQNNFIVENEALADGDGNNYAFGGGIAIDFEDVQSKKFIFENNNVIRNSAYALLLHHPGGYGGGGICSAPDIKIRNSIAFNNFESQVSGSVIAIHCNIQYGWSGSGWGNIDADPLFVDTYSGDFHLRLGSPCIDAGTNSSPSLPEGDFEGDARIIDGNWPLDGDARVDIGADEALPEIAARFGNINAKGIALKNVLLLNGGSGDKNRIFSIATGKTMTLTMGVPSQGLTPSPFALYVIQREPGLSDIARQPYGIGAACMPMPLTHGINPPPFCIANSIGYFSLLGYPIMPWVKPAPCTIINIPYGFPVGTYTLQGYILDNGSKSLTRLSLTNAIVVRVK